MSELGKLFLEKSDRKTKKNQKIHIKMPLGKTKNHL